MNTGRLSKTVTTQRLQHLEALASLVSRSLEEARYVDAVYDQTYSDMARELRALGYQERDDIPRL